MLNIVNISKLYCSPPGFVFHPLPKLIRTHHPRDTTDFETWGYGHFWSQRCIINACERDSRRAVFCACGGNIGSIDELETRTDGSPPLRYESGCINESSKCAANVLAGWQIWQGRPCSLKSPKNHLSRLNSDNTLLILCQIYIKRVFQRVGEDELLCSPTPTSSHIAVWWSASIRPCIMVHGDSHPRPAKYICIYRRSHTRALSHGRRLVLSPFWL